MPCQTCDHTMHLIGPSLFHCPRCGTMSGYTTSGMPLVVVPALVDRCRAFGDLLKPAVAALWVRIGIAESINPPDERPKS